jgi:hypothetical protein
MSNRLIYMTIATLMLAVAACSSNSHEPQDDPTTRALSDPMNYSPRDNDPITGGNLTDFNHNAFKKDMDHVANP